MLLASDAKSSVQLEAAWRNARAAAMAKQVEGAGTGASSSSSSGGGEEEEKSSGGTPRRLPDATDSSATTPSQAVVVPLIVSTSDGGGTAAVPAALIIPPLAEEKKKGAATSAAAAAIPIPPASSGSIEARRRGGAKQQQAAAAEEGSPVLRMTLPRAAEEAWVLLWREWATLSRAPALAVAHVLVAAVLAVWIGAVYWDDPRTQVGAQNRCGVSFFTVASFGFSSLSALDLFLGAAPIFRKEAHKFYGPTCYYFSKARKKEDAAARNFCSSWLMSDRALAMPPLPRSSSIPRRPARFQSGAA